MTAVPAPGSRGPSRPRILGDAELSQLIRLAGRQGRRIHTLTEQMQQVAAERGQTVREMRDGGMSVRAIGEALGLSVGAVQQILRR